MAGVIKDGSGSWRSVGEMLVKTSDTSWNSVQSAWVKADDGTWKQWFRTAIRDAFSRTTSGNLGSTDTAQTWVANSGVWYATGSVAQSDTAASSYPVASVNYGAEDAIVSASVSQGTGPAVWVSGSNNWYAAISYSTGSTTSYSCNCSCNGHYTTQTVCTATGTCNATTCPPCSSTSSTTYSCSSGTLTTERGSYECKTCTTGSTTYKYCGSAVLSYSCATGSVYGSRCVSCDTYPYYLYNGAGSCKSLFDSSTIAAKDVGGATSSYSCTGTSCETNTCPGCSYYSCYNAVTSTSCSYTSATASTTTTCSGSCSYTCCTQTGTQSVFVSGGTYPNCDSYGSSCQTCTTSTVVYYLRLLASVNGVVTTLGSDITLSSAPAAIKMITSGNTITYQAYSDTGMSNTLGSQGSYTVTSPTKSTYHGIVKAPNSSTQQSTIDNFSIKGQGT